VIPLDRKARITLKSKGSGNGPILLKKKENARAKEQTGQRKKKQEKRFSRDKVSQTARGVHWVQGDWRGEGASIT